MIPLPLLPEIFFYDIDKEKQVYDDPPKAIFRLNIIGNMSGFDLKLRPYTDRWFKTLTFVFVEHFRKELSEVSSFMLGKKVKPKEVDEYYRLKMESDAMENEAEEEMQVEGERIDKIGLLRRLWRFFKKLTKKLGRIIKWLKNTVKFLHNLTRRVVKFLAKWVKKAAKIIIKIARAISNLVKRCWRMLVGPLTFLSKSIGKYLSAFWKMMRRFLVFMVRSFARVLRAGAKALILFAYRSRRAFSFLFRSGFRKFIKPVLTQVAKASRKVISRLVVKIGQKYGLKWAGGLIAKMFGAAASAASGAGTAISVSLAAWTAYDIIGFVDFISNELNPMLKEIGLVADKMETLMDENGGFRYKTPDEIAALLSPTSEYKNYNFADARAHAEEKRNKRLLKESTTKKQQKLLKISSESEAVKNFYEQLDKHNSFMLSVMGRMLLFQKSIITWFQKVGTDAISLIQNLYVTYNIFSKSILDYLTQFNYSLNEVLRMCEKRMPKYETKKSKKPKHIAPKNQTELDAQFKKAMAPLIKVDTYRKEHSFLSKFTSNEGINIEYNYSGPSESARWGTMPRHSSKYSKKKNKLTSSFYMMEHDDKLKWLNENADFVLHHLYGDQGIEVYAPKQPLIQFEYYTYDLKQIELKRKRVLLEQIQSRFKEIQNHYKQEATIGSQTLKHESARSLVAQHAT